MTLALIAYPELISDDNNRIESLRRDHDDLYSIIKVHFTLIFPINELSEGAFLNGVESMIEDVKRISFVARCATINKDALRPFYHAFLVLDEGNSAVIKLHDLFYNSPVFRKFHRLDIDYIPHVVLASSQHAQTIKNLVDQWNLSKIEIKGRINSIEVVKIEAGSVNTLRTIKLV